MQGVCSVTMRYIMLLFSSSVLNDSFATPRAVARLALSPWDFPGKNTGLDYHFLLQENLSNPRIEPEFPALAGGFLTIQPPGKPYHLKSFCLQVSEHWKNSAHHLSLPWTSTSVLPRKSREGETAGRHQLLQNTLLRGTHGQRAGKGRGAGTSLSRAVGTADGASNALNFQEPMICSLAPSFIWVSPNSF